LGSNGTPIQILVSSPKPRNRRDGLRVELDDPLEALVDFLLQGTSNLLRGNTFEQSGPIGGSDRQPIAPKRILVDVAKSERLELAIGYVGPAGAGELKFWEATRAWAL
jgi:hypothetical protein